MGVSKNRGTPNWMVKIMETPIKMDDLVVPPFEETPIYLYCKSRLSIMFHPPLWSPASFRQPLRQ